MADERKPRVVIAGGGVAAIEALLALRDLAGDRVEIELMAPEREFVYRPLAVAGPFDLGDVPRFELATIAADRDAAYREDALVEVDSGKHLARTRIGHELAYDALVVATGADPSDAVPGALTYRGPRDRDVVAALVAELEQGDVNSVAFVVPSGSTWPLPVYELALITAARLRATESSAVVRLVTPEDAPLALFGRQASEAVAGLLAARGVELHVSTHTVEHAHGALTVVPGDSLPAERVVALPRLQGRAPRGVPADANGFVPVDPFGLVRGLADVYAAGDVTTSAIKQGGVAAQQADVVAAAIAARFGVPTQPEPFRPVLRGMLLTGDGARFMRAEVSGGRGERSELSTEMLWWPEGKIAARYLTHYLARRAEPLQPDSTLGPDAIPVDVELAATPD